MWNEGLNKNWIPFLISIQDPQTTLRNIYYHVVNVSIKFHHGNIWHTKIELFSRTSYQKKCRNCLPCLSWEYKAHWNSQHEKHKTTNKVLCIHSANRRWEQNEVLRWWDRFSLATSLAAPLQRERVVIFKCNCNYCWGRQVNCSPHWELGDSAHGETWFQLGQHNWWHYYSISWKSWLVIFSILINDTQYNRRNSTHLNPTIPKHKMFRSYGSCPIGAHSWPLISLKHEKSLIQLISMGIPIDSLGSQPNAIDSLGHLDIIL